MTVTRAGLSAFCRPTCWRPPCGRVPPARLASTTARRPTALNLREAGFAETHLHIGAGLDFGSHWIGTVSTLLDTGAELDRFQSPGGAFGEGIALPTGFCGLPSHGNFSANTSLRAEAGRRLDLNRLCRAVEGRCRITRPRCVLPLRAAVRDVMRRQLDATHDLKATRWAFRRYCQAISGYNPLAAKNISQLDPLEPYFPAPGRPMPAPNCCSPRLAQEMEAARRTRHRLRPCLLADITAPEYLLPTSDPAGAYPRPGLVRALFRSDRAGRQATPLHALTRIAASVSGAGRGLRYFEFRTSPPDQVLSARSYIRPVFPALAEAQGLREAALVCHFIRSAGGGKKKGCRTPMAGHTCQPFDRKLNPRGYRYQTYAAEHRNQAITVARLLARYSAFFVTAPRDRPMYRRAGCAAVGVCRHVPGPSHGQRTGLDLSRQYDRHVPPLRRTVHAGEDYPHLLTGLRLVGDTVRRLDLKPGDRLGHALALGFDPDRWAQTTGKAVLPLDVRLFDLAWEWDCRTGPRGIGLDATRAGYLDRELRTLSAMLFGRELSPREVSELADDLHNPEKLKLAGYPNGPRPNTATRGSRVVRYLTDPGLFVAGSQPVKVDAASRKCGRSRSCRRGCAARWLRRPGR